MSVILWDDPEDMQSVEGYLGDEVCRLFVEYPAVVLEAFPQNLCPLCIVDLIMVLKKRSN